MLVNFTAAVLDLRWKGHYKSPDCVSNKMTWWKCWPVREVEGSECECIREAFEMDFNPWEVVWGAFEPDVEKVETHLSFQDSYITWTRRVIYDSEFAVEIPSKRSVAYDSYTETTMKLTVALLTSLQWQVGKKHWPNGSSNVILHTRHTKLLSHLSDPCHNPSAARSQQIWGYVNICTDPHIHPLMKKFKSLSP